MRHARCALADTSAVGFLVRRPPTNRDGDALTGRRLLVRPGARFDYPKHEWARFVEQGSNRTEL